MTQTKLCLFSSTPDILDLHFLVRVLTGTPEELAECAVAWGYDGIEFLPDPLRLPDPHRFARCLRNTGAALPVVNTGRVAAQGLALFHPEAAVRKQSIRAFKDVVDFAGALGARVGLGMARGTAPAADGTAARDRLADDVFRELAGHAAKAGAVIMLEASEMDATRFLSTMGEVMSWVERIASPAFGVMLDTEQLAMFEPSVEAGIRAARGQARHIHLYDPSRWPPGVGPARLDWDCICRVLRAEGFAGTGSVVLVPEGDPQPAARRAAAFLRAHLGAVARDGYQGPPGAAGRTGLQHRSRSVVN